MSRVLPWKSGRGKLPSFIRDLYIQQLIAKLQNPHCNDLTAHHVMSKLVRIGVPAVEPLINALWKLKQEHQQKAINAFIEIGSASVEPLIRALENRDWSTQRACAEALGHIGDRRAIEPLLNALNTRHSSAAAEALGKFSEPRVIEPLINALGDTTPGVRRKAAAALGEIGDERAVAPLINALQDSSATVQESAIIALEDIRDSRAIEPLVHTLESANAAIRQSAAMALGDFGDTRAIAPLLSHLWDSNWRVREKAAAALKQFDWQPETIAEQAAYFAARSEWEAVAALGTAAIKPLILLVQVNNPEIQTRLTDVLARIYAAVEMVIFNDRESDSSESLSVLYNPDASDYTLPLSDLQVISITTAHYDFYLVERFITYAVNALGQKYLKKHVNVRLYGDPEQFHPNLRNAFENLCKNVMILPRAGSEPSPD